MKFLSRIFWFLKIFFGFICSEIKAIAFFITCTPFRCGLKSMELIVSNSLGGGTASYLNNTLKSKKSCLLLMPLTNYFRDVLYIVYDSLSEKNYYIKPKNFEKIILESDISILIINSLVSYKNVYKILNVFTKKLAVSNLTSILMVHDFFMVCPFYNLTKNFSYCELQCSKGDCHLVLPYSLKKVDVNEWRRNWRLLIDNIKEVRTFDKSGKDIFEAFYQHRNITVVPHSMDYFSESPIVNFDSTELKLGVVGSISRVKGRLFLSSFANFLDKNGKKITIIGSIFLFKRNVIHAGKYNKHTLREKLIKHRINVILFPSICPETFSYVISELIQLQIPIVCFDLGAQANKIRNYSKGIVAKSMSNEDVYDAILECYRKFIIGERI